MPLHFEFVFEDVPSEMFLENVSGEKMSKDKLEQKIKDDLDETVSTETVRVVLQNPPRIVYRGTFSKTDAELYKKYGREGLTEQIKSTVEDIYGYNVSNSRMEKWWE